MLRFVLMGTSLATLAACVGGQGFDGDFRRYGKGGFSTSDAALNVTTNRPQPDARGIISYPGYQVAVARQGDTVESVAARVGLSAAELASYNALAPNAPLRRDEVLALPRRVDAGALPWHDEPPIWQVPRRLECYLEALEPAVAPFHLMARGGRAPQEASRERDGAQASATPV